MKSLRVTAALSLCGGLLVGCSVEAEPVTAGKTAESPTPSAAATAEESPEPVTSPLEGTWRVEQTKADIVRNLRQHGFGRYVQRFLAAEGTRAQDIWEYDFYGENLTARYLNADGTWHAGVRATIEVDGDELRVYDLEFLTTDIWRWTIDGDQLRLEWLGSEGPQTIKGLPVETFVRAYYTPPMTRVA